MKSKKRRVKKMKFHDSVKRAGILISLFCLVLLFITSGVVEANGGSEYHPSRILIKFKHAPSAQLLQRIQSEYGLKAIKIIKKIDVYKMNVENQVDILSLVSRIGKEDIVEYAEPDYIRYASFIPNDTLYPQQWGLQKIGVEQFWDVEMGSPEVVVAVLDTGIDLEHPDLLNQLWVNPGEIAGNLIDDDGNGYVDDINGYDFHGDGLFLPPEDAEDSVPQDDNGHGTHVSGRIAADTNNSIGVAGMAPNVKLMAVRVLGGILGFGYSSDIIEGVLYAVENGANVINMSLGGTDISRTEYDTYKVAYDSNVFIAAASGNEGDVGNPISYPAGYVFNIAVGATDENDDIAYFSTYGPQLEVAAPGVETLSTILGGGYSATNWSGTSMASPHVAGLAALLYSRTPTILNWQVRLMIRDGVVDAGTPGWDQYFGFGRIDCPTLLGVAIPSTSVLHLINPIEGSTLSSAAILSFAWTPVDGAASYALTVTLPNGNVKAFTNLSDTILTISPNRWSNASVGNYTWEVQALDTSGGIISLDSSSFSKQ